MIKQVTMPRLRPRWSVLAQPADWDVEVLLRAFSAVLVLTPVAVFLLLFSWFVSLFSGFSIGGRSDALDAVYRLEDTIDLIGAGVVGVALITAILDVGSRWVRILICLALAILCVIGGVTADYLLRCPPAELDPFGGHKVGEIRCGRVFWEPLAIAAGVCTFGAWLVPTRIRRKRPHATTGV